MCMTVCFAMFAADAQEAEVKWAVKMDGAPGHDGCALKHIDDACNLYLLGTHNGDVDVDPGPGKLMLPFGGFYISKLDSTGKLVWARGFTPSSSYNQPRGMVVDALGNIYVTGSFSDSLDFDPGPNIHKLRTSNTPDIFVMKLNSSGNFVWAHSLGGKSYDYGNAIVLDGQGNLYVGGSFTDTVDFDPSPTVFELRSKKTASSQGSSDAFLLKLDTAGRFISAIELGDESGDEIFHLASDASGNVYVAGETYGNVDFDPGPGVSMHQDYHCFVLKLSASNVFQWVYGIRQTSWHVVIQGLAVDKSNNVFFNGFFYSQATFDPGKTNLVLNSKGRNDVFIGRINAAGTFGWVKHLGNPRNTPPNSIALDNSGNVYTVGITDSIMDFDPGNGKAELSSNYTSYILKLSPKGDYIWAMADSGTVESSSIILSASGDIFYAGSISSLVDLNPGPKTHYVKAGNYAEGFVARLSVTDPSVGIGDIKYENGPTIFPNPSSGIFTLSFNDVQIRTIAVYNDIGLLIHEFSERQDTYIIDLENCAKGVYVLQLTDANGNAYCRKVVKL